MGIGWVSHGYCMGVIWVSNCVYRYFKCHMGVTLAWLLHGRHKGVMRVSHDGDKTILHDMGFNWDVYMFQMEDCVLNKDASVSHGSHMAIS